MPEENPQSEDTRALPQEQRGGPVQNASGNDAGGQALPASRIRGQATIKVCLHEKCRRRGGEQIYANLKEGLSKEEAIVLPVYECFNFCSEGPNIAINDNIVRGVKPFLAVERVRQELRDPSCRADGLGSKSLDDLDAVLEDITKL